MSNKTIKSIGATLVVVSSIAYSIFRIMSLQGSNSAINLIAAICEITALALVSVEAVLLSSGTRVQPRQQDENVLIESAKQVLFSSGKTSESQQAAGGSTTKVETATTTISDNLLSSPVDVLVFAKDATYSELRRCFLSLKILKSVANVYVINSSSDEMTKELYSEFDVHEIESTKSLNATTENILVCRGTDILYPDVVTIAKTYNVDKFTFLELRSVFSDESALGENGLIEINDKRQQIRESLSTRGLATWSTGPAMVASSSLTDAKQSSSAEDFFRSLERSGMHAMITQEIASEEISHEQTVAEVDWRALDFRYTARAWGNSYKKPGTKTLGSLVKLWSALVNVSFVRRIATLALVLVFVLDPARFSFVTSSYLLAGIAVITAVLAGGYLTGDRRSITSRLREFYFDVEAVTYNVYKGFLNKTTRGTDKSIVKKLPSVSMLLIFADVILVYRVVRQYNGATETLVSNLLKNASLFAGYLIVVSLLVGLGMVIVRQSRSALRREISRGANLDSEPVSMVDLSPGGAGCISVMPYEEGHEVAFESSFPIGEKNTKFSCRAVIRSSVKWNDSHRLGIEFTELDRKQLDILETYCSIVYPHSQARDATESERILSNKGKVNGKAEKRFLSYAASFIALGAVIFSNITTWG